MTNSVPRVVVAVALGVAGVAGVLWRQSASAPVGLIAPPMAPLRETTAKAAAPVALPAPIPSLPKEPPVAPALPMLDEHAENSDADADRSTQPVPVVVHVRNRRESQTIDGEVVNPTAETLSVTLRDINSSTQASSELQFVLAPGEHRAYGTDSGFYIASGDELTVHSPPYQDKVVRVP